MSPLASRPLKLLVTDIDGCLIEGERALYDFEALAAIRELNRAAPRDDTIPSVTICSGRPYPYVEAMLKLVDSQLPAIFEHGCGLYFPQRELRHECAYHPRAVLGAADRRRWEELVQHVLEVTGAGRQCAKQAIVTFFPPDGHPPAGLAEYVEGVIAEAGLPLEVGYTASSVDVTPRGLNKGAGLRWLLDELRVEGWDLDLAKVAAVGDSVSDLSFLQIAGFSAAPANAAPQVLASVDYVSPQSYTRGVLDILELVIEHNRNLSTA